MEINARPSSPLSNMPQGSSVSSETYPPDTVSGPAQPTVLAASGGELAPSGIRIGETTASQKEPLGQDVLGRLAHGTAERLQKAAATVRERSQRISDGSIGQRMAEKTAETMDQAAHYIDETSAKTVGEAVRAQIQKHPWVSVAFGLTVGVWLGRSLKR